MTGEQRAAVVAEALTWLGTPYHHHARVKGAGVDCAQLLCAVFEACGLVPHVDPGFYAVDWHMHRSEERFSGWLARFGRLLADSEPMQAGDVGLFKYGRTFSHGAIHVHDGTFVHAYLRLGVIVSEVAEEPLCGRTFQRWAISA